MVNPLLILAVSLGTAFLFAWIRPRAKGLAWTLLYGTLGFGLAVSAQWLVHFYGGGASPALLPGGFDIPAGIALGWGPREALLTTLLFLGGLLGAMALFRTWQDEGTAGPILTLLTVAGSAGLVMSRDLFNLFVFMEITGMSTAGLLVTGHRKEAAASGFKMMLATGLASVLFLIGTVYVYRLTGTLALDAVAVSGNLTGLAGFTALFLVVAAVLVELKLWPANGWALDAYTAAHPVIAGLISTVHASATLFVLYKLLPLLPAGALPVLLVSGLVTFVFSQLAALRQEGFQRMLAYSSAGTLGLFVALLAWMTLRFGGHVPAGFEVTVLGGMILTHVLAKGGLFWMTALSESSDGAPDLRRVTAMPLGAVVLAVLMLALAGLPPFPAFWAKWSWVGLLAQGSVPVLAAVLAGTLIEALVLFRWLGRGLSGEKPAIGSKQPVVATLAGLLLLAPLALRLIPNLSSHMLLPVAGLAVAGLFFDAPRRIQTLIALALTGVAGWLLWPITAGLGQAYLLLILGAGAVLLLADLEGGARRPGQIPLIVGTLLSVAVLGAARSALDFWTGWELMTVLSALLVLRGREAQKPAWLYWAFSMAGAYLLLAGLALALSASGALTFSAVLTGATPWAVVLISLGFLFKAGALGLHLWVPEAYAESEDEATPFIAALVSKAPVVGLLFLVYHAANAWIGPASWWTVLGWIGVLTALWGALMATFQEDAKKLLAYSSMGQIGYIVAAVALGNYAGWVAGLYLAVNHILYKGLLFLTLAGVIAKVQTRLMYQMGGLIKRMPLSFVAVLISIIAVSGVPPLTGFGGKWMLYSALIEAGWSLQAGVAFFASAVAFLYLYRLIHTVFLGMPKNAHLEVKEVSIWRLVPMFLIIGAIMALSAMPKLLLDPIMNLVGTRFPATLHWEGNSLVGALGYWNGSAIMMATLGVFMIPLIWLLFRVKDVQVVKPFNIVFAAEKPERPETTHVAHNFFAHYRRALGFWVEPRATRFWNAVGEWTESVADWVRQWATGNGQTYAVQILLFISILYFFMRQTAL